MPDAGGASVLGVPLYELFIGINEPAKDHSKALMTVVKAMFKSDAAPKRS